MSNVFRDMTQSAFKRLASSITNKKARSAILGVLLAATAATQGHAAISEQDILAVGNEPTVGQNGKQTAKYSIAVNDRNMARRDAQAGTPLYPDAPNNEALRKFPPQSFGDRALVMDEATGMGSAYMYVATPDGRVYFVEGALYDNPGKNPAFTMGFASNVDPVTGQYLTDEFYKRMKNGGSAESKEVSKEFGKMLKLAKEKTAQMNPDYAPDPKQQPVVKNPYASTTTAQPSGYNDTRYGNMQAGPAHQRDNGNIGASVRMGQDTIRQLGQDVLEATDGQTTSLFDPHQGRLVSKTALFGKTIDIKYSFLNTTHGTSIQTMYPPHPEEYAQAMGRTPAEREFYALAALYNAAKAAQQFNAPDASIVFKPSPNPFFSRPEDNAPYIRLQTQQSMGLSRNVEIFEGKLFFIPIDVMKRLESSLGGGVDSAQMNKSVVEALGQMVGDAAMNAGLKRTTTGPASRQPVYGR